MAAIAVSSAQQVAPGEKKVWDGVYTAAQAARGKPRFEASCSRCHNIALAGSERGPALKGSAFWSKWENESLGGLYTVIRDTMPRDGGASVVSDEIKTDILAYILSVSGMPAGNDELKVDLRALDGIKIAKKTVWDGVFTAVQADRGKENYLSGRCGGCHKLDLTGDRGPALKGEDFIAHLPHQFFFFCWRLWAARLQQGGEQIVSVGRVLGTLVDQLADHLVQISSRAMEADHRRNG